MKGAYNIEIINRLAIFICDCIYDYIAVKTSRLTLTFSRHLYCRYAPHFTMRARTTRGTAPALLLSHYCLVSLSANTHPLNCGKIAPAYRALRAPATEFSPPDRCYKIALALTIAAIYCLTPAR